MEREIVLSRYNVKNDPSNKPENFKTRFLKPITLNSNHKHVLGLNIISNMSFTWFTLMLIITIQKLHTALIMVQVIEISHFQLVLGDTMILIVIFKKSQVKKTYL